MTLFAPIPLWWNGDGEHEDHYAYYMWIIANGTYGWRDRAK